MDLAGLDLPFPLRFEECEFDSAPVVEGATLAELALTGCTLAVAGRQRSKLDLLAGLGIETVELDRSSRDLPAPMLRSFDIAVDCTGDPSGFLMARQGLRARGTLIMKSTYAGTLSLNASSLVVDEITIIGSRCGPFEPALELLRRRRVEVAPMIHARYPLEEGIEAFEHAQRPGVLKVVMTPFPSPRG